MALSDIQEFFREECAQTGTPVPSEHVTRFKRRVHDILPDELTITKHSMSQKLYIAWRENMSVHGINLALHAKMGDLKKHEELKSAATYLRNKIADVSFEGTLNESQELAAAPKDLLTFLTLLIEGSALSGPTVSRAALTCAEIIVYNFRRTVARKTTNDVVRRHSPHLEPPLQVYLAMKIHATVKSKAMVNTFHGLGLCISYRRSLEILTSLANMHCISSSAHIGKGISYAHPI